MIKKWQREECDGKNISTNPAKGGTDGKQERGVQEEATNMMGDLEKLRKNKREREKGRACIFLFSLCTLGNQFFYQSKCLIMLFSPPITFLIFHCGISSHHN